MLKTSYRARGNTSLVAEGLNGQSSHSSNGANKDFSDRILIGDVREVLPQVPDGIVDCIITSPPYFKQRDYNDSRQIGAEADVQQYITTLIEVFQECRRVMKDSGSLWLNLGDKYSDGQLLGLPWRVALALQSSGWILRSEIIWHKPNAMPHSVDDRPTTDHEQLFFFTKSPKYYYDVDAIREPHVTFSEQSKMRGGRRHFGKRNGTPENGKNKGNSNLHDGRWDQAFHPKGRNKRTVWSIPLGKYRGAHFAVFPEKLIEPCVMAGCPQKGLVLDPFFGAGTVGLVAGRLGRRFLGVELNSSYAAMAKERLRAMQPFLLP